jgi:hypothetical protein
MSSATAGRAPFDIKHTASRSPCWFAGQDVCGGSSDDAESHVTNLGLPITGRAFVLHVVGPQIAAQLQD